MVARGKFFLYDSIVPALPAGGYTLTSSIDMDATDGEALPVQSLPTHFNVTAPRMKLPPDQTLMTFPPANSEGSYEARLPQIVLKKRTLPWDRQAASPGTSVNGHKIQDNTPWLALVLIAEGEGQIVHDQPVADCVTPGTTLTGSFDSPQGSYLSVPQSTVNAVFPTIEDLTLLTHVREVNVDDTEAAMGDDDGFLAVVISNRSPQFDTINCKPKSYTACLINLEKQLAVLPEPAPPRKFFDITDIIFNPTMKGVLNSTVSGAAVPMTSTGVVRTLDTNDSLAMSDAVRRGEVIFHDGLLVDRAGVTADGMSVLGRIDERDFLESDFSRLERTARTGRSAKVHRVEGSFAAFDFPLHEVIIEKYYRFPVLTSWRFTCAGAGSFQSIMSSLDVGLLGTVAEGGYKRPAHECVPATTGEGPGAPPVTQLPLEITETGHIGLPHLTRTGENSNAWYRGPFSPHKLLRNPLASEAQFPVLAHVSDHLRMMTPDGREDVSLAVAFETGRLLAMSQPSFVASLQRWRNDRFGVDRAQRIQRATFFDKVELLDRLPAQFDADSILDAILGNRIQELMEAGLIRGLDLEKENVISDLRDFVDPGVVVGGLRGNTAHILADGLGLDRALISQIAATPNVAGAISDLQRVTDVRVSDKPVVLDSGTHAVIDGTLENGLGSLAETAIGNSDIRTETIDRAEEFQDLDNFLIDRFGGK